MDHDDGRRHPPGTSPAWCERWSLDFWSAAGDLGGVVDLTLWPGLGRSWFWASLVGAGRRLVTVIELEASLPAEPGLELRAPGLWVDLICETPLDHFTVGLEAFGVALDHPDDALAGAWGDRTPLGLDLEWETSQLDPDAPVRTGCVVHGEVLVGDERIDFDGFGSRSQSWGQLDWTASTFAGRADDGTAVFSSDGLTLEALADAPVAVRPDGRGLRLDHRLCRFRDHDVRRGLGWQRSLRP